MTLKEKNEIIDIHINTILNDFDIRLANMEEDIYDMDNFDKIMNFICMKEKYVKTIRDLIDLEEEYDNLKIWFEHNEMAYIYYKYYDVDKLKSLILNCFKKPLKEVNYNEIVLAFRHLRERINKEIKSIDSGFLFKEFYDYVDKLWEEM